VTQSFSDFVMLRCCESAIFIEIWSAFYQSTKRVHVYGAGARRRARGRRGGGRSVGCSPRSDPWVAGSGDGPTDSSL
jgi:hypothetical protein